MRLSKETVKQIADAVVSSLETKGLGKLLAPRSAVSAKVVELITADLTAEDRLDAEVRKILESHEAEIAKGGMDYRKLFDLTKRKLAGDRGIVL
jgi:hypothetical protein